MTLSCMQLRAQCDLKAPDGSAFYQWFYNGVSIPGANNQVYDPEGIPGRYYATHNGGKDWDFELICPTGGTTTATLTSPQGTATYQWYDTSGLLAGQTAVNYTASATGVYYVVADTGVVGGIHAVDTFFVCEISCEVLGNGIDDDSDGDIDCNDADLAINATCYGCQAGGGATPWEDVRPMPLYNRAIAYSHTGHVQKIRVPLGVDSIKIVSTGAGSVISSQVNSTFAGATEATIPVQELDIVTISVTTAPTVITIHWDQPNTSKCYVNVVDPADPTNYTFGDVIYDTIIIDTRDTIEVPIEDGQVGEELIFPPITNASLPGAAIFTLNDTSLVYDAGSIIGDDVVVLKMCNAQVNSICDTVTFNINVRLANEIPIITFGGVSTTLANIITIEDEIDTSRFSVIDPDGPFFTTSILDEPDNGILTIIEDTALVYAPKSNYSGFDSATIVFCDSGVPNYCDTMRIAYRVNPSIDTAMISVMEDITDTTYSGIFYQQGVGLSANVYSAPQHGITTVLGDTAVKYDPDTNYFGLDSFAYRVCENSVLNMCDTFIIRVNMALVNDKPEIYFGGSSVTLIPVSVREDERDTTSFNIVDPDRFSNTSTILESPLHGSMIKIDDTTYAYHPGLDYSGYDTAVVRLCDNDTLDPKCDTASYVFTIIPSADSIFRIINEDQKDTVLTAVPYSTTVPLTSNIVTNGSNGVLTIYQDTFATYVPTLDYNGTDMVKMVVCSGVAPSFCDTFVISYHIDSVNDAPIITESGVPTDLINFTTLEDTKDSLCFTVIDVDGLVIKTSFFLLPFHGDADYKDDTCLIYTPDPGFFGSDTMVVLVCDSGKVNLCDTVSYSITVNGVNDKPIITFQGMSVTSLNRTTLEEVNDTIPLVIDDPDVTLLSGNAYVASSNGAVTLLPNGNLVYDPDTNYNGADNFSFRICDGGIPNLCDSIVVNYAILPVNDYPIIIQDGVDKRTHQINILEDQIDTTCYTVVDIDGPQIEPFILQLPVHGNATILADTCFVYDPDTNYFGNDTIIVKTCDLADTNLCDTISYFYTLTPVNDRPFIRFNGVITDSAVISMFEDEIDTSCFTITDDPDGPAQNTSIQLATVDGDFSILNTTCFIFDPDTNYNGVNTAQIKLCDGGTNPVQCDSIHITYRVNARNDFPIIWKNGVEEDTLRITLVEDHLDTTSFTVTDIDNLGTGLSLLGQPKNGNIFLLNDTTISYHPDTNYYGGDTITAVVCDLGDTNLCDSITYIYDVTPFNDRPEIWFGGTIVDTIPRLLLEDHFDTVCITIVDPDGPTVNTRTITAVTDGIATILDTFCFSYDPDFNFNGTDLHIIEFCDGGTNPVQCDTLVLPYTVPAVNDQPFNTDTLPTPIRYDTTIAYVEKEVCFNLLDYEVDPIDIEVVVEQPKIGFITGLLDDDTCITYKPFDGEWGNDTMKLLACDTFTPAACDTITLIFTIEPLVRSHDEEDSLGCLTELAIPVYVNDSLIKGEDTLIKIINDMQYGHPLTINNELGTIQYNFLNSFVQEDIDYAVCVVINNGQDTICDTAHLTITTNCTEVDVPEAITPNGDGINDLLIINNIEKYAIKKLKIFNRNGLQIFMSDDYQNDWAGTLSDASSLSLIGQGEVVPPGVYFYALEFGDDVNNLVSASGYIHVIK